MDTKELDRLVWECRHGANTDDDTCAVHVALGEYVDFHYGRIKEAYRVLRSLEWSGLAPGLTGPIPACPCCGVPMRSVTSDGLQHSASCSLAKVLQ